MGTLKRQRWIDKIKAQKKGEAKPLESDDEEVLHSASLWAWNAFVMLNSQRHLNDRSHPLPISLSDINGYMDILAIPPWDREPLLVWIVAMDRVYLEVKFAQIEQELKRQQRKEAMRTRRR